MFPYEGTLKCLRGQNYYTKEEIQEIIRIMKTYKLKFIPLFQTFGHLEYTLKNDKFAHLREQNKNYTSVCPLKSEAKKFVRGLIDQVIQIIGPNNIEYMHIGADEVFNMGTCQNCQFFAEEAGKDALYSGFMKKICKKLHTKYPHIQLLAWDDMYRNQNASEMQKLKYKNQPLFQPCVWAYSGNQQYFENTVTCSQMNNMGLEFKKVWVASAFKGAYDISTTLIDLNDRLYNHKYWVDRVKSLNC